MTSATTGDLASTGPVQGRFGVVALAASLGSLDALTQVLSALPAGFPAPVVVVRHVSPRYPGFTADLLRRRISLETEEAEAGVRLRPGVVYVAPPDRHLLVRPGGSLALDRGPKVNFVRPAADKLFESVAHAYGSRAIGVVLTGSGRDGARGIQEVKGMGGVVIAQDQATSEAFGMPSAAVGTGCVDFVLPLGKIPAALVSLAMVRGASPIFGVPALPAA